MPTLLSAPSDINRETVLCVAADTFLEIWRAWTKSADQLLTAEFEESLDEMLEVFRGGDIPASCREMSDAARALDFQWNSYRENVTTDNQMPNSLFWGAVEGLYKAASAVEDPPPPMRIEPLSRLFKDGVKPTQIAKMYGTRNTSGKWEGPFCRNGELCVSLVLQEEEQPGSILPAGWIHPDELNRRKLEQSIMNRRAMWESRRRAKGVPVPQREAPESIEELLRLPGMTVRQIRKIKNCTEADVHAEAERIGVKLTEANEVDIPHSRAADSKKKQARSGKIPPKPDTVPEPPGLGSEVQAAAQLNPGWSHSELATEFGVTVERIGELLAGGGSEEPDDEQG